MVTAQKLCLFAGCLVILAALGLGLTSTITYQIYGSTIDCGVPTSAVFSAQHTEPRDATAETYINGECRRMGRNRIITIWVAALIGFAGAGGGAILFAPKRRQDGQSPTAPAFGGSWGR
ncbi:MAG TPA: hypothetical protein VKQ71_03660 [Acidimicrobiales bacterium]|nr:hypothetical protein [Acidimicrobiales bacterium]